MNVFHLKSFHPFLLLDELDAKICLLFYVLLLEIINHSCLVEELTVTLQHLTRRKQTVTLLHFTLNNNSATRLLFFYCWTQTTSGSQSPSPIAIPLKLIFTLAVGLFLWM